MNSLAHGNSTFAVEVTNISKHGIWLLANDRELFLSYEDFPWFLDQPIKAIIDVEQSTPGHFYWPEIDVDISEEIIANPDHFPLKAKHSKSPGRC